MVLHKLLLVSALLYGNETLIYREKERSVIMSVRMDNIRGLLGIRRMTKVPNAEIKELCGLTKVLDERIDESVLLWFGHIERMVELLKGYMWKNVWVVA